MTSHLLGLKSLSQSCSHCCKLSKSACKASASEVSWIVWYTRQSSANSLVIIDAIAGRSFIKTKNSRGSRTMPWGTPDVTNEVLEDCPIKTRCIRRVRNALIHCRTSPRIPKNCSLRRRHWWGTLSNALEKSSNTASICCLEFNLFAKLLKVMINWVLQEWRLRIMC